ncbi:hypothetical protein [Hansschlegelia sp. KR7-227]|uniref:hypothetical protein n=1 Tax=Hansschlegelia sp. KR7-227 TaxID=3400914 RepID=UPI003C008B9A
MSTDLKLAQAHAWSLATTLMACVVLLQTELGYSVMAAAEFDGDLAGIVHEFDPFG